MPWNNQGNDSGGPWGQGGGSGGNNGGGSSPWGQGGGGGGKPPQDIDELVQQGRDALRKVIPGGGSSGRSFILLLIIFAGIWAATGFYRVNPQQQGVVLRFGEFIRTTAPGLHYHIPFPVESVLTPEVTRDNRIEIGFRDVGGSSSSRRDIADESQMITGDENIVDIDFVVFWRVSDAGQYLFNLAEPDDTIKVAAEAVMREIIGRTTIQTVLTEGRQEIQVQARQQLQDLLNEYGAGVRVRDVQLLAVDPPGDVIDAFNEVQRARQDRDKLKNQADAFRNDIVPRARGEAAQLVAEAQAYEAEVVNRATGDASRFDQVYKAYLENKDVTKERIYIETIEEIFSNVDKIIIDENASGNGVVPYLPLNELNKKSGGN
ncbi:FtsH protease activity modulator HflK [Candidatus Puniceispirillum sp.]|uniref:FtsH protease activity modulator HflK n=1 Tax=Candidatus Puniceispirillum sp. TaxID=2026719 RepID=UPI003F69ED35